MSTDTAPISSAVPSTADIQALLQTAPPPVWWRRPVVWGSAAAVLLALAGAYAWQNQRQAQAAPTYVSEVVQRGNLTLSVSANGTLQPTRSVNIGSELSGTVKRVLVDVNDRVKTGQVLVELDTAKLVDQVTQSRAALASAQAQQAQASASARNGISSKPRRSSCSRNRGTNRNSWTTPHGLSPMV